ncbi:MAG: S41 family peptidase, partial [Bacteroidota bacterium]
ANGTSRQYRVTPSALDVQAAFEAQSEVQELNDYFNLFFTNSKIHISDSLLSSQGKKALNDNLEWGKINNQIGYLGITSFAGFLNKDFTRAQQIDSIKTHMDEIITAFQDTKAIIIDISFNFGGYDASALTIASYFTDELVEAFTCEVFNNGKFYQEDKVFIQPAKNNYTKPVYILMTDISRSAAEGFAMMMDALPNVTLIGTNTLGILSGMLGKSIGDYYTTYSNQRLVNTNGEHFEGTGVQPDVELKVFPKDQVMKGHLNAVKTIMEVIEDN